MKHRPAGLILRFLLISSCAASLGAQDTTSDRVSLPRFGLSLQYGPTQTAHEKLRAWVAGNPVFRDHLAWLSANLALPNEVPVSFQSCGTANAFYNPRSRSITFCYELIAQRIDRARARPGATDAAVTDAVTRSTLFIVNHEVGHALINLLSLPVLGREEDAADGFGAFILLERGGPQDAYSVLQGAEFFGQHTLFDNDVADEHSLNDQRYFNVLCWMLGSDQARFAGYAQRGGLPASRQQRCVGEWSQLRASWIKVLDNNLRPGVSSSANATAEIGATPVTLVNSRPLQLPAGQYWTMDFHVNAPQCRVSLNVRALTGGNLDVETMIFERPAFLSWQAKVASAEPVFKSGHVRQTVLDVPIRGPGDFSIVVSNAFSMMTAKTAQATVRVACP
ncbi:MAG: DUF4344 domain-containing metallopeptidase [Gemmatimonadaceae bacterium]